MMKMTNEQIDTINKLLLDHSEALTAFYDEGIRFGMGKGFVIGLVVTIVSGASVYGLNKIKTKLKLN